MSNLDSLNAGINTLHELLRESDAFNVICDFLETIPSLDFNITLAIHHIYLYATLRPRKIDIYVDVIGQLSRSHVSWYNCHLRQIPHFLASPTPKLAIYIQFIRKCCDIHFLNIDSMVPIFLSLSGLRLVMVFAWFFDVLETDATPCFLAMHDKIITSNPSGSTFRHEYPQLFATNVTKLVEDPIAQILYHDDIDAFNDHIKGTQFNPRRMVNPLVYHPILVDAQPITILNAAAAYGAVACFKAIFVMSRWTAEEMSSFEQFACMGGCHQIIRLSGHKCRSIEHAVYFHQNSIAEWIESQGGSREGAFTAAAKSSNLVYLQQFRDANSGLSRSLLSAASEGHVNVLSYLTSNFRRMEINISNDLGDTALHIAIKSKHTMFAEQLLRFNEVNINYVNDHGYTPLHTAVASGNHGIVEILLGFPAIMVNAYDAHGHTPLHIAAMNCDDNIVQLLVDHPNVDPLLLDHKSQNPLHLAVQYQNEGAVETLLSIPFYVINSALASPKTPFIQAIEIGNDRIVQLFLDSSDLDINQTDRTGNTPLHTAVVKKYRHYVTAFLEFESIDVNAKNYIGNTPLHMAVISKSAATLELLLQAPKIVTGIHNDVHQTPLDISVSMGFKQISGMLISHEQDH